VTAEDQQRIDARVVAALYADHAAELHRFLVGVLRDSQLASDVLQTAFARLVEVGHRTRDESRKAWLFRVAYREALALRRRQTLGQRHLERAAWTRHQTSPAADAGAIRAETLQRVQELLDELPPAQRQVVRMRIYEEKTFAVIARELNIPLGTALGRMRAALMKLQQRIGPVG